MGADGGGGGGVSSGDSKCNGSCLRRSGKSKQAEHSAATNGGGDTNGLHICGNGVLPNPMRDKASPHDCSGKCHDSEKFSNGAHGCRNSNSNKKLRNSPPSACASCSTSKSRFEIPNFEVENGEASSLGHTQKSTAEEEQWVESTEVDMSIIPGLGDDVSPLCLARLSPMTYGSYRGVSRKFRDLFENGELHRIRRQLGICDQWIFLLNNAQSVWRAFDPKDGGHWRSFPPTPADECFLLCDKESLTAGTQLLVIGREIQGLVVWRYDLGSDSWYLGPQMNTPRCLYASASQGEYGYVAGGVDAKVQVTNSAERYNSWTGIWESLPSMQIRRKLCSGFYMDGKFWVIGGVNEREEALTCGEEYDPETREWKRIENMFPHDPLKAPPLVAVVENQLYSLDISANQLKLYCKRTNMWKLLGDVPVRAGFSNGWGLAFKGFDGQLVLIGGHSPPGTRDGNAIYAWKPSSNGPPEWRFLTALVQRGTFVFNCAVMSA